MRAMTFRGPSRVRVEEKPVPRIQHENDAVVRVERAAICGSDLHLHLHHGMMSDTRVGHTFGLEFIGSTSRPGTPSRATSSRTASRSSTSPRGTTCSRRSSTASSSP
nr:alcohol dehydrogenase catalytic domain-containing protein [Curtobacterium luteum]